MFLFLWSFSLPIMESISLYRMQRMVMFMVMFTIFTQAGVPARSGWSQMNTIDHIAVSIAASASATVAATVVRAIMVDAQS